MHFLGPIKNQMYLIVNDTFTMEVSNNDANHGTPKSSLYLGY